jgi:hypothetical protein
LVSQGYDDQIVRLRQSALYLLVGLSFLFPGVETHGRAMTVGSPQRSP